MKLLLGLFLLLPLSAQAMESFYCDWQNHVEMVVDVPTQGMPVITIGGKGQVTEFRQGSDNVTVLKNFRGDNGPFIMEGTVQSRKSYYFYFMLDSRPNRVSTVITVSEGTNRQTGQMERNVTNYSVQCRQI